MSLFPDTIWIRLTALTLATSLALGGLAFAPTSAQRHKTHSRRSKKRVISDKEARAAVARKSQLGRKLAGLHSHIHAVQSQIHQAKAKEHRITESLQTVETRLDKTKRQLAAADARLEDLEQQHSRTVHRLEETQQRLLTRRKLLSQRIRYNYERGQTTYAHTLLQSTSLHEALSRSYYVQQIVHSDTELIQGVKDDIVQIERDKRLLERQKQEQEQVAAAFQEQKQQYASDMEEKQELLQGVKEQRAQAEDELDGLEEEANAMTDTIRALSEQLRQRREAQRQAQAQANAGKHGRHRHEDSHADSGEIAPVWHGGFIHPVSAPITSGFGYRYHPILHRRKLHTGIDFGASYGSSIHAAAGGTVIMAHYTRGYGNCVVIDHGNGVTTLYGHCSSLSVSEGDTVHQGQTIANVGSTGLSTGPHLHFEMRRNGVPVAPF